VQFDVRGLVLAGGNSIGKPGTVTEVVGALVCSPSSSPTVFYTQPVSLSPQGMPKSRPVHIVARRVQSDQCRVPDHHPAAARRQWRFDR
jgi:hypothetical protein